MGWSKKRIDKDGRERWTARYRDLKQRQRSAGTFSTEKQADKAWQRAEARLGEGQAFDPARGRMRFRRYVTDKWLPDHVMEPSTREGYVYSIDKHIMPEFGSMRMMDIWPEHVREWVTKLQVSKHGKKKLSANTIRHLKMNLSAIFTTAFTDHYTYLHPCKGIKTPTVSEKPLTIITPEQFDVLHESVSKVDADRFSVAYQALPNADAQLLIETDIETGQRWGELTELRPKDFDRRTRIFTISRAVVEVNPKFHPEGQRFWVKEYPKDGKFRRFKVSAQIATKIEAHIENYSLGPDDLLFAIRDQSSFEPKLRAVPNPDELGLTEPNEKGRQYQHGTLSAYNAGKCRCDDCKAACAIYRAKRRAEGKDDPRQPRTLDTDGHIPNDWFRNKIWKPALKTAGLQGVRVHDLRHAHASWVLAGGADIQVVKERLGHGSIATTERYLHTLPDADETALSAFDKIRQRSAT